MSAGDSPGADVANWRHTRFIALGDIGNIHGGHSGDSGYASRDTGSSAVSEIGHTSLGEDEVTNESADCYLKDAKNTDRMRDSPESSNSPMYAVTASPPGLCSSNDSSTPAPSDNSTQQDACTPLWDHITPQVRAPAMTAKKDPSANRVSVPPISTVPPLGATPTTGVVVSPLTPLREQGGTFSMPCVGLPPRPSLPSGPRMRHVSSPSGHTSVAKASVRKVGVSGDSPHIHLPLLPGNPAPVKGTRVQNKGLKDHFADDLNGGLTQQLHRRSRFAPQERFANEGYHCLSLSPGAREGDLPHKKNPDAMTMTTPPIDRSQRVLVERRLPSPPAEDGVASAGVSPAYLPRPPVRRGKSPLRGSRLHLAPPEDTSDEFEKELPSSSSLRNGRMRVVSFSTETIVSREGSAMSSGELPKESKLSQPSPPDPQPLGTVAVTPPPRRETRPHILPLKQ
ncbi:hypothetical protein DQ04_01651070 [Trypanosoma grayi]|uniref:hypothetical protein n=1 Tax=Trypanosoma grayi TaxID=71804 RepID=UPI0004F3FB7A|nr:hypothetical protein DQ04_01651070 [Trypanosoma grayi]KEG12516.1 hypothetical protein DQ04_01651070 [Trypanosoma grayi]